MKMNLWHLKQNLVGSFLGNVRILIKTLTIRFPRNLIAKTSSYGVLEKQKPKHFTTNGTTCFKHFRKNYNNH